MPDTFQFLLPSSRVEDLDADRDKNYIIESLMRGSSLEAWRWMNSVYKNSDIIDVLKTSTNLRKKDVVLWSNFYNVPEGEIACLQTTSRSGLKSSWAY